MILDVLIAQCSNLYLPCYSNLTVYIPLTLAQFTVKKTGQYTIDITIPNIPTKGCSLYKTNVTQKCASMSFYGFLLLLKIY